MIADVDTDIIFRKAWAADKGSTLNKTDLIVECFFTAEQFLLSWYLVT